MPYDELDPGIIPVVRELNRFPGLRTIESCEGHAEQGTAGEWSVIFRVAHTEAGWRSLEFVTWFANSNGAQLGSGVRVDLNSMPPYINRPGRTLYFNLWCTDPKALPDKDAPDAFARWLREFRLKLYIPAERKPD